MIPQFPQFKKLELADRADVEAHTHLFEPYSDFEFICLWAWDVQGKRMISELNDNLIVKFTDYHTHEPFLSFLGINNREDTMKTLFNYCKDNDLPETLRLLPDISINGIDQAVFTIEESSRDFDYILSTKEIAILSGTQFHRRRKNANRFWRENPLVKLKHTVLSDKQVQQEIFETINTWEKNKIFMKKDYVLSDELMATKRMCESDKAETLLVLGLYLESTMLGYAIGEVLPNKHAMLHFLKSNILYIGSSEALMQAVAQHFASLSVEWINIESDLGVESMRQSKISWRPVKFLKRYNVRYPQS